jgi:hypothetical protein
MVKEKKNSEELETGCIGAGFSCAVRAMRVGYLGRGLSGMTPNQKALKGPAGEATVEGRLLRRRSSLLQARAKKTTRSLSYA